MVNVTQQGAARDAASVHFRPSIMWTDVLTQIRRRKKLVH